MHDFSQLRINIRLWDSLQNIAIGNKRFSAIFCSGKLFGIKKSHDLDHVIESVCSVHLYWIFRKQQQPLS